MANQSSIDWFLKHQEVFNFRVTELIWPQYLGYEFHDFEVKLNFEDNDFVGRGTDRNEEVAILKAFAESVERMTCDFHKISSYGVAVHSSLEAAKESAYLETFERISFFRHFNERAPFELMNVDTINLSGFSDKYEVNFYRMSTPTDTYGVICIATDRQPAVGAIVGLAVARTLEDATEKAYLECARNMAARMVNPRTPLSVNDFKKIEKPSPFDRQRLLLDQDYLKLVSFLFPNQVRKSTEMWSFKNDFDFQELKLPLNVPSPLVCIRALSSFEFESHNVPHFLG